ncbi:PilN domain-containing protein [Hyphomicrobium sp.]|uniref:PilN domain-containing protein n=1 Tax=Hyphomicrobium sp. TaxID=82 RepID=UPI002D78D326|nr:PilN domain-containing protein [Hyphomicrobium sp.]HET6390309.1 PilN domain-containing protein [Hyphomicrobium sp.]
MGEGVSVTLRTYFEWWLMHAARALTPRRDSAASWRMLARQTEQGLEVYRREGASETLVGVLKNEAGGDQIRGLTRSLGASGDEALVRLSSEQVVERVIQIPAAARDVVGPVLQNQIERLVPWPQDETCYGYRVISDDKDAGDQLDIQLVATTRGILDEALQRARSIGLSPFAVDYAPGGASPPIEMMSLKADPVQRTAKILQRSLAFGLAVSVVVSASGLYLMWCRYGENDDIVSKLEAAKSRVAEVKRLNEENSQLRQQRERLVRRKINEPPVIVLIDAVSRALPDTAYLTEIEIHGSDARIVGKSDDPTALITKLESTPELADVRFAAPTTREPGETIGTFSIIARAEGAPKEVKQP